MTLKPEDTLMYREAAESGDVVQRFLSRNRDTLDLLGARLRERAPSIILTCGRGSSDHASTYGKYVLESRCGVPVISAALSITSVYQRTFADLTDAVLIAVSQSGKSPDLLAAVGAHQAAGATVVALVNDVASPLARMADIVLPLHAGPELSVAATKSCIASMIGFAAIAASWSQDSDLTQALEQLPHLLTDSFALNWSAAIPPLIDTRSMYVIGRGYGYGIAQEMALKLKETCGIHAESFSAAEVRHGPMAIVRNGFPVLALATSDRSSPSVREVAAKMSDYGAAVILADTNISADLPAICAHPVLEPVLMLSSFYRTVNELSINRGLSPDKPPFLAKVTQTM